MTMMLPSATGLGAADGFAFWLCLRLLRFVEQRCVEQRCVEQRKRSAMELPASADIGVEWPVPLPATNMVLPPVFEVSMTCSCGRTMSDSQNLDASFQPGSICVSCDCGNFWMIDAVGELIDSVFDCHHRQIGMN